MSTTSTVPPGAPPLGGRRAYRDSQTPVVGGVASGLARHLGVPVLWVRAGFVVAAALGGMGVFMYAGLWFVLPSDSRFDTSPPGLASATRGGRRPRRGRRLTDAGPAIVLGVLGIGALFALQALFGVGTVFWPLALAAVGIGLLWRQADEAQWQRWLDSTGRIDPVRVLLGDGGWQAWSRIAAGFALVVAAMTLVILRSASLSAARDVILAVVLGVLGLGLVVGPWLFRMANDLTDERTERVRTQERADLAAHLHDSVLQTLALIQKNAADGSVVARLARTQERELRSWLFEEEARGDATLAAALRAMAAAVEDDHGVSVEVVVVGDAPYAEGLATVVAAAREAVTNAAKHAGADRVDVYAEIGAGAVAVFGRDRGVGSPPDAVPEGRFGLRHSIVDRMGRHGGRAEVRSTPGEGTEIRLFLPIGAPDD